MKKLRSRIEHMERRLTPAPSASFILAFSDEEAEQKIKDFQHQFPGQEIPKVIIVRFVKSKWSEKQNN